MEVLGGERAVFFRKDKILALSDTHIGFEIELGRNGVFVPDQVPSFLSRIASLVSETGAKKILLLGDVKHSFVSPTFSEEGRVVRFLEGLLKLAKVEIVPGNHDGDLANVIPKGVKFHSAGGVKIGKFGFFHGHAWPDKKLLSAETLVLSHLHPNVVLKDSLGGFHKEPCFLAGKLSRDALSEYYGSAIKRKAPPKVLVIPAFNALLGGAIVQEADFTLGFWKCIERESLKVVLSDGTILGVIDKIGI